MATRLCGTIGTMKNCQYCGKLFQERTDRPSYFCSIPCSNKSRRKHFPKPCVHCAKLFEPPRNHPRQKYCSTVCRNLARTSKRAVPCSNCGKIIVRSHKRWAHQRHVYCSWRCMSAFRVKHDPRGRSHPQYIERIRLLCDTCGSQI